MAVVSIRRASEELPLNPKSPRKVLVGSGVGASDSRQEENQEEKQASDETPQLAAGTT